MPHSPAPLSTPSLAAGLIWVLALTPGVLGCGAGVFDGQGNASLTVVLDSRGGDVVLGQAHLSVGPGTFNAPTAVTLRRIPAVQHAGAYGPVFEIAVPAPNLIRQDPILELEVPFIGPNQPSLALGALDPGQSLPIQQWVPVSDSTLDPGQGLVRGSVQGLSAVSVLQFGAVVKCPAVASCPSDQACNSGACQQCPTGSPCS